MADARLNFATSTVATAPSPATSGTSLVVAAGEGARFATPPFNAVICPSDAEPTPVNAEIVRVTGIATDTCTITRTQESSAARTVVVGDSIYAGATKKTFDDSDTRLSDVEATDSHFKNWYPGTAKAMTNPGLQGRYVAQSLTGGYLYLYALSQPLRAGVTLTSITFLANGAGSGMTNQWFTLVNKADLKTLRSTVDDGSTAWAVNSLKTLNLSSTYVPATDINAYLGVVVVGTTRPTLYGPEIFANVQTGAGLVLAGYSTGGLTTPVADNTTVAALTAQGAYATAWVS